MSHTAAVLECLRHEILLRDDIACYCLDWGIPFSTRVRHVLTSPPHCPPNVDSSLNVSLSWHPQDYQPNAVDYESYEAARDSFLSQLHARAVVMQGGILWHLVFESIDNNAVLIGLTDEAFIRGDVVCFDTNLECWDDKLTDEDINLICGVYKVYTGML